MEAAPRFVLCYCLMCCTSHNIVVVHHKGIQNVQQHLHDGDTPDLDGTE